MMTDAVWALPRSLATTGGIICYFLFLGVLRCFSSPGSPPRNQTTGMPALQTGGLSHSDIQGSTAICASPRLFAAYHVLHRLREPRHPPCALDYFSVPKTAQLKIILHRQSITSAVCADQYHLLKAESDGLCSLACFNMSKIKGILPDTYAFRSIPKWRITDSNR